MAQVFDYEINTTTADLVVGSNGDFSRIESSQQSVILVLNTAAGSWRWNPFCGMNIKKYKGATGVNLQMKREMIVQLEADGYRQNDGGIVVRNYDDFYLDIERTDNGGN